MVILFTSNYLFTSDGPWYIFSFKLLLGVSGKNKGSGIREKIITRKRIKDNHRYRRREFKKSFPTGLAVIISRGRGKALEPRINWLGVARNN